MSASRCPVGLLGLLLAGCADGGEQLAAGVRALRAGQAKEALTALAAAERAYGDAAPPELWHDLALARLATGDLRGAEVAAEKSAANGSATFLPLRDFVLGSAAFARCGRAEAQASGPEAEPFAFEVAIGYAMAAQSAWQKAAASRDDWPEARRNVERAQQKIAELRDKKTQAQKRKDRADQQKAQDRRGDERKPENEQQQAPQPPDAKGQRTVDMLELLVAKEKEKRELRRVQQLARTKPGDKGW